MTELAISSTAANNLPTDSTDTDNAAASINEALTSPSIQSQDQHSSDPLFGSLNSKITTSLDSTDETPSDDPMDKFFSPEVQISGKIPSGDNMDGGIAAHGAFRGQVSKPSGKENLVSNSSPTRVEITITISTAILIKCDKNLALIFLQFSTLIVIIISTRVVFL